MIIHLRRFGTTHRCHLQCPKNPSSPNITNSVGYMYWNSLCCNYIERLRNKTQILIPIISSQHHDSKLRISLHLLSLYLRDCSIQVNKAISSFTYVTDYELGIEINANQKGRINLEDVTTSRVVQYYISLQTRNTCILIGSCAEVFNCKSQMYASNETKYFITVLVSFLIQPVCIRPSFCD